jgi:2-hydroxychromene-2-carboxylate isomerase
MADRVLEAARHADIDARVLETEAARPEIKRALRDATAAAYELGVFGVPTIAIDDELFWGDDRLEDAAAHLRGVAAASGYAGAGRRLRPAPTRPCLSRMRPR